MEDSASKKTKHDDEREVSAAATTDKSLYTYNIAFDFEALGGVPHKNGFTKLGAVLSVLDTGEEIDSFSMVANQGGYEADPRCVSEFWMKHAELYKHVLDECAASPHTCHDVIRMFKDWIKAWASKLADAQGNFNGYLITDCSTFDTGMLKAFCDEDIMYILGAPRDVIDTSAFFMGVARPYLTCEIIDAKTFPLVRKAFNLPEFTPSVEHDHEPVNDARCIFQKWRYINMAVKEHSKSLSAS